jgi:hypothetical protein
MSLAGSGLEPVVGTGPEADVQKAFMAKKMSALIIPRAPNRPNR